MQPVVALDGSGSSFVCPECSADSTHTDKADPQTTETDQDALDPADRFRRLLEQCEESPHQDWLPEDLLEDLPPEAQTLLKLRLSPPVTGADETLSEEKIYHLRQQGYVVDQDAHGIRISGRLTGNPSLDQGLSASDIVRLAADLDGGLPTAGERKKCPKCEALNPPGGSTCQWCGEALTE
jgi:hypothetical protein